MARWRALLRSLGLPADVLLSARAGACVAAWMGSLAVGNSGASLTVCSSGGGRAAGGCVTLTPLRELAALTQLELQDCSALSAAALSAVSGMHTLALCDCAALEGDGLSCLGALTRLQ